MGAKQSGPAAANGRTRAYSGGDLPSSSGGGGGANGRPAGGAARYTHLAPGGQHHAGPGGSASGASAAAPRSRSLGGPGASGARAAHSAFNIPNSSGLYGSQDSVSSTPEEGGRERAAAGGGGGGGAGGGHGSGGPRLVIGSLPAHLSPHLFGGFKCPVCSKFVSSDEMDLHLVMCLTKPRITYNGECTLCAAFVMVCYH
ncbi:E3 ubiquitin-protein ligase ZNRF2 isoform X2 [Podarcis muralis]